MSWKTARQLSHQSLNLINTQNLLATIKFNHETNEDSFLPECEHQSLIIKMKQKMRELECGEKFLKDKNDRIINGIKEEGGETKEEIEEEEQWRKKYLALKADNDRKEARLLLSVGERKQEITKANSHRYEQSSKNKYSSLTPKSKQKTSFKKSIQTQERERELVQDLKCFHRRRSMSLKSLDNNLRKKYCSELPEGIIVQIIDNRNQY